MEDSVIGAKEPKVREMGTETRRKTTEESKRETCLGSNPGTTAS